MKLKWLTQKQRNNRIDQRLAALEMSKGTLATLYGCTRGGVTYLYRRKDWRQETVEKVASILQCDPRFLMFLEVDVKGKEVRLGG